MEYLTQKELKEMIILSCRRIEREKEQINKINVFPVPDQDTGNNLAKTLEGIRQAIEEKEFKDLTEIAAATLDGALTAAQGNAGVIYTGFLAGFMSRFDKNPVNAKKLAAAFKNGSERARQSIQNPKEGTILDVIDATSQTFGKESEKETDIVKIFKSAVKNANEALLATREKMEIFRKANVVDAGGLGFLIILESYLEALEGKKKEEKKGEKPSEKIRKFVQILSKRYEIVSLIENPVFDENVLQEKLKRLGNCLDIVRVGNKVKLHIHTDYPDEVKEVIRKTGQVLDLRTEDMAREVAGEESVKKVDIGIVTEDVAPLLSKIIERYQIEIVPTGYDWPPEKYLPGENIYQKMREATRRGIKVFTKTTQATPQSYLDAFQKQSEKFDKVLCLTLSSKLSGCHNSAVQAKEMLPEEIKNKVFILDSLQAASGQALFILRAIELIQEQREIGEVVNELKNLIPKIHFYVIFEDPKWIEMTGRITKSQADWIRRIKRLNLHPVMTIREGVINKGGIVFAKDMAEALFKRISKESERTVKQGKKIRVLINHADNLEGAEKLKKLLKSKLGAEISFISLVPTVIGIGVGPGTLVAAWIKKE